MRVRVEHGDMLQVLRQLRDEGVRVHSIVTDPPYHLTSIVQRFGKTAQTDDTITSDRARSGADGMARLSRGFMGKVWDGGDIAFQYETWRLCYDLLPPGGHLIAFSGTRTYHRMAVAIEEAGFEIRDMISWLYGSGFPKSHNVAKGIDKAAGRPIATVPKGKPVKRMIPGADQHKNGCEKNNGREYQPGDHLPSDEAEPWDGWGTALKPALEPICLARKPLDGTVAANVLKHGTGALNIDGCKIESESLPTHEPTKRNGNIFGGGLEGSRRTGETRSGRWPANVVHDGSDEVVKAFPDQVSGGTPPRRPKHANSYGGGFYGQDEPSGIGSSAGNASRFFYSAKADADDRLKSKHPTVKPVDLMAWLIRLVTPPGGLVLDPFAGSGTTGMACLREGFDCILVEREAEYVDDIRRRLKHVRGDDTPLFDR